MKRVVAILVILSSMFSFSGCGNESKVDEGKTTEQTEVNETSQEKEDGSVEVEGNNVVRYYNSDQAYGKATWTFDENEKITSLTLELTSKNGSSLDQVKKVHLDGGFELVESTSTSLKMKAGKKLLENEKVKHTSKNDLVKTLEAEENQ
ncbi:MAG: hypothetical protein IJ772_04455 [Bacilli bacterium]|nr:hypothetical protein [Bacilli bacterium]